MEKGKLKTFTMPLLHVREVILAAFYFLDPALNLLTNGPRPE